MPCPKLSNPIDPTPEDLRLWAYTPEVDYPDEMEQDWDLCITDFARAPLLLQFSSDRDCPNRKFFLQCLYTLAGDCVRVAAGRVRIPQLQQIMKSVPADAPADVHLWSQRCECLLLHPETYDYNKWGWGDYAYDSDVI